MARDRARIATLVLASDADVEVDLGICASSLESQGAALGGRPLGKGERLLGPRHSPAGGKGEEGAGAVSGGRRRCSLGAEEGAEDGKDPHGAGSVKNILPPKGLNRFLLNKY